MHEGCLGTCSIPGAPHQLACDTEVPHSEARRHHPRRVARPDLALLLPKEQKVSGELLVSRRRGATTPGDLILQLVRRPVYWTRGLAGWRGLPASETLGHHARGAVTSPPFGESCAVLHRSVGLRYERFRGRSCWSLPPRRSVPGVPLRERLPLQSRWSSICLSYIVPSIDLPALSRCAGRRGAGPGGQPLKLRLGRASSVSHLRSLTSTRVCGEAASEDATSRVFTRPRLQGGSSSGPTTAEAVWDIRADRGRAAFRPVRSISWTPLHFRGAGAVPS